LDCARSTEAAQSIESLVHEEQSSLIEEEAAWPLWNSGRTIGADLLNWSSDERSTNGDDVEQIEQMWECREETIA